jgi:Small metal-binding protein
MFPRRSLIAILAVALAPLLAPTGALAADHRLDRAIWETEEALDAGRRDQVSLLVEHAVEAAHHARLAISQNPHARITIDRGVAHLDRARSEWPSARIRGAASPRR